MAFYSLSDLAGLLSSDVTNGYAGRILEKIKVGFEAEGVEFGGFTEEVKTIIPDSYDQNTRLTIAPFKINESSSTPLIKLIDREGEVQDVLEEDTDYYLTEHGSIEEVYNEINLYMSIQYPNRLEVTADFGMFGDAVSDIPLEFKHAIADYINKAFAKFGEFGTKEASGSIKSTSTGDTKVTFESSSEVITNDPMLFEPIRKLIERYSSCL